MESVCLQHILELIRYTQSPHSFRNFIFCSVCLFRADVTYLVADWNIFSLLINRSAKWACQMMCLFSSQFSPSSFEFCVLRLHWAIWIISSILTCNHLRERNIGTSLVRLTRSLWWAFPPLLSDRTNAKIDKKKLFRFSSSELQWFPWIFFYFLHARGVAA